MTRNASLSIHPVCVAGRLIRCCNQSGLSELLHEATDVYYSLGRPLASVFALNAIEVEEEVSFAFNACEHRVACGGTIRISGDWLCEASLYTVVSLLITRLRRYGHAVELLGSPFAASEAPAPRFGEISILLDAHAYPDLSEWAAIGRGKLGILVGRWTDSEIYLKAPRPAVTESIARRYLQAFKAMSPQCDPLVYTALLLSALGIDLPPGFLRESTPPPHFVAVRNAKDADTGWTAIPGAWLARRVVGTHPSGINSSRLSADIKAYPHLMRRLDNLLRLERH